MSNTQAFTRYESLARISKNGPSQLKPPPWYLARIHNKRDEDGGRLLSKALNNPAEEWTFLDGGPADPLAKEKLAAKARKTGRRGYHGPHDGAGAGAGAGAAVMGDDVYEGGGVGFDIADGAFDGAIQDPDIEAAVNGILEQKPSTPWRKPSKMAKVAHVKVRTSKKARESKLAAEEIAKARATAQAQARRATGDVPDKLADRLADQLLLPLPQEEAHKPGAGGVSYGKWYIDVKEWKAQPADQQLDGPEFEDYKAGERAKVMKKREDMAKNLRTSAGIRMFLDYIHETGAATPRFLEPPSWSPPKPE